MTEEKILTMHPDGKSGRSISKRKYDQMRQAIIGLLQSKDLNHNELISSLQSKLENNFFDNIVWFGETVILDMEARGVVEKNEKYHLKK